MLVVLRRGEEVLELKDVWGDCQSGASSQNLDD